MYSVCVIMSALFDDSRFVGFPENRFEVLDELLRFFDFNKIDLRLVLRVLIYSSDGCLAFCFGDVNIEFSRSIHWSGDSNAINLSIELETDDLKRSFEYEYNIKDLLLS